MVCGKGLIINCLTHPCLRFAISFHVSGAINSPLSQEICLRGRLETSRGQLLEDYGSKLKEKGSGWK